MKRYKFSYPKIANRIIEWGIIFLIVFTPIAFGTVHPWAYTVMELTICFLVTVWIVRLALININKTTPIRNPKSEIRNSNINRFGFIKTPLNIPIIIFVGLILFQLTPLSPGVLKILSPNTYKLYKTTLPDWQPSSISNLPESEEAGRPSSLVSPPSSSPSWQSISVYKHATKTELYKILAYIGIFFLIVNYNPSTRSRQPVSGEHRSQIKIFITRLIIVMIVVGCFESFYGLLEYLSGHQYIFFRQKVHHLESVTGTYLNRNHFAGYMAIVICMSFGYLTYLFSGLSKSRISLRVSLRLREPTGSERDSTESATGWRQKLSHAISLIGTRAGLLSFLILIMSSALILSGSRMGIFSFIIVVILMTIMMSKKISIKKISIIVLPVCLLAVWIGINPVIKRFSQISRDTKTEAFRPRVWKDTCNLIKDFPALGTGLGTYEYAFPKYKTLKDQVLLDHAHQDYLQLISDTGFTGFIIVIAGAAYYLFIVIRMWFKRRNPFVRGITIGCLGGIAYIILHSFTDFNLQIPANALHLSIITGIMHKTLTQL